MSFITKELAYSITEKLEAIIDNRKGNAHTLAKVIENGVVIAVYGLRHSSKKNIGHDHIPRSLHISAHDAKRLGQCPMKREQYIKIMEDKGFL